MPSPTTATRHEYRHARLLDHGRGDWAMTIARRYLYETSDAVRLDALVGGSWPPLAQLCAKLVREERYHLMHINAWFSRLAATHGEPRERLIAALDELAPDAATVFTPLPGERSLLDAGILAAPMTDLEIRWRAAIAPVFESHGLAMPPAESSPAKGREAHGAAFAWLWGEFNQVRRSDPGAVW